MHTQTISWSEQTTYQLLSLFDAISEKKNHTNKWWQKVIMSFQIRLSSNIVSTKMK
jgi:hypothetical protein